MTRLWFFLCLFVAVFAMTALAGEWTGYISDSHCGAKHTDGSQAAVNCVKSCVKGGQAPVFVTADNRVVKISNPDAVKESQLGKKVKISGELKEDKLTINSIELAG